MSTQDLRLATIDDCWNRIGVCGDQTCPELTRFVHCHNCPVFSTASERLLTAPLRQATWKRQGPFWQLRPKWSSPTPIAHWCFALVKNGWRCPCKCWSKFIRRGLSIAFRIGAGCWREW